MYNINRRKFLGLFGYGCCSLMVPSCSTVPITDRKQLSIIPEAKINSQAAAAYEQFRLKSKLINKGKQLDDNDKVVNAWCMPGGKIAVYTGLLKITQNTNALSIVMGHEIAHAVAKHSVERASQAMTINLGTTVADIFLGGAINRTRNTIGQNTGMDILKIGIFNPFGRKQETEADYLGLIFSSLAGYDIRESIKLWERMAEKNKGKEPPVFLSTHPSSKKRIENLKQWINQVIIEYPPIKV